MARNTKANSEIDALIKQAAKQYDGAITLHRANDVLYPFNLRRPTGVVGLDAAIGGGWPAGSLCQIYGPDGTAKNFLCYATAAQVQQNYGDNARIAICSLGYGLDVGYARLCGMSLAHSDYEIAQLKEEMARDGQKLDRELERSLRSQVGEVIVADVGEGGAADQSPMEALLEEALVLVRSGVFQLVIIDEAVGAGATRDMLVKGLSQQVQMADQARLLTQFVRRFFYAIKSRRGGKPNETTILLVAQSRMNLKPYGGNYAQSGGQGLKHAKALDVHTSGGKLLKQGELVYGKEVKWRVAKAKLGTHEGAAGLFELRFDMIGFHDPIADLFTHAKDTKLIRARGSWYYLARIPQLAKEDWQALCPGTDMDDEASIEASRDVVQDKDGTMLVRLAAGADNVRARLRSEPVLYNALVQASLADIPFPWRVR